MVCATAQPQMPAGDAELSLAPSADATADLARDKALSRLCRRRLEMIPPRGPGAPYAAGQADQPGDSTTPAELSDLISSISETGVLHPTW